MSIILFPSLGTQIPCPRFPLLSPMASECWRASRPKDHSRLPEIGIARPNSEHTHRNEKFGQRPLKAPRKRAHLSLYIALSSWYSKGLGQRKPIRRIHLKMEARYLSAYGM